MNTTGLASPKFKTLARGQIIRVEPSSIIVSMTGATHATQDRTGWIKLHLCNGSIATRKSERDVESFGFFSLVDFVLHREE